MNTYLTKTKEIINLEVGLAQSSQNVVSQNAIVSRDMTWGDNDLNEWFASSLHKFCIMKYILPF